MRVHFYFIFLKKCVVIHINFELFVLCGNSILFSESQVVHIFKVSHVFSHRAGSFLNDYQPFENFKGW